MIDEMSLRKPVISFNRRFGVQMELAGGGVRREESPGDYLPTSFKLFENKI